jgi:hypothetical protein
MADLEFGLCWVFAVICTAARRPGDDPPNRLSAGFLPAGGRFLPLPVCGFDRPARPPRPHVVAPPDGVHCRSGPIPLAP